MKKNITFIGLLAFCHFSYGMEIQPIKTQDNYLYKVNYGTGALNIIQNGDENSVSIVDSIKGKIDINNEEEETRVVKKVYQQGNKTFLITSYAPLTCGTGGAGCEEWEYFIYEIEGNEIVNKTSFSTDMITANDDVRFEELQNGFKFTSDMSSLDGRTFIYEFKNGNLYNYSTQPNKQIQLNNQEKFCKIFYKNVQTADDSSTLWDFSGVDISYVPNDIKKDENLVKKIDKLIKMDSLTLRKEMPYNKFKENYCNYSFL